MPLFKGKTSEVQIGQLGDVGVLIQNASNAAADTASTSMFQQESRALRQFLTNQMKETIYFFEPLTYSGINKTANRMFYQWLKHDTATPGESMDEALREDLEDFHKRIQLRQKLVSVCIDSMVYGNGFLELIPANSIPDRGLPLLPAAGLKDVVIADPLYIQPRIEWINQNTGEFYYLEQTSAGTKKIHNSRIIHIPWATLGTMRFGRGAIEIAIRSVFAKLNMDWALGEVIYRHGKPFIVLTTKDAGSKELEKAYKVLQNINPRTHFAGTDRHKFEMLNPSVVDPEPFAHYYYFNLAAAMEMPHMELLGAQSGQLTGSEVDKTGWYANLRAKQENKFTDVIHRINNQYLKGGWRDEVFWNPIFIDEKSEAEIGKIQADTVKVLYYDAGLLTDIEARQLCRDMGVSFPDSDDEFIAEEKPKPEPGPASGLLPPMFGQPQTQTSSPSATSPVMPDVGTKTTPETTSRTSMDADKADFIKSNEPYWRSVDRRKHR